MTAPEKKQRVLIVDDTRTNIDALVEGLKDDYQLAIALNGETALKLVRKSPPDLILLDVMMPGMDGFEVCRQLHADEATRDIPVIFLTALDDVRDKARGFEAGGEDYVTKPFELLEVKARVRSHLLAKAYRDQIQNHRQFLEKLVAERTAELVEAKGQISQGFLETVFRLAVAAEYKDRDTGAHILRIGQYTSIMAEALGLDKDLSQSLVYAAPLHDIGKIGVPDGILLKPGKLDDQEMNQMRQHTLYGAKILEGSRSRIINLGRLISLSHHERWDGKGYPHGIGGEEIPLPGRLTAVADVFDALVSKRCYKEAMPIEKAFAMIVEGKGSHFDPVSVDVFLDVRERILEVSQRYANSSGNLLADAFSHILSKPVQENVLMNG